MAGRCKTKKKKALGKGYDSILLMAPHDFVKFKWAGKVPRRMELNVLSVGRAKQKSHTT